MAGSALYFLTGSSGSGKTTLLRRVVTDIYPALSAGHVDDLGAPQGARAWAARAAAASGPALLVVVEGQERPHVVLAAARDAGLTAVRVVLIDCDHTERRRRLREDRAQPELDHLDMYAWAAYLRGQADRHSRSHSSWTSCLSRRRSLRGPRRSPASGTLTSPAPGGCRVGRHGLHPADTRARPEYVALAAMDQVVFSLDASGGPGGPGAPGRPRLTTASPPSTFSHRGHPRGEAWRSLIC